MTVAAQYFCVEALTKRSSQQPAVGPLPPVTGFSRPSGRVIFETVLAINRCEIRSSTVTSQQPNAPYPSSAPHSPAKRTNTLAVVSLVLAFVAPLIGFILGFVALSQVKSRGENGRGLALSAVIVGGTITALYVVLIIAVAVAGSSTSTTY